MKYIARHIAGITWAGRKYPEEYPFHTPDGRPWTAQDTLTAKDLRRIAKKFKASRVRGAGLSTRFTRRQVALLYILAVLLGVAWAHMILRPFGGWPW